MDRTETTSLQDTKSPALTAADVSPEFRRECVEFFAEAVQALGIPRSIGQIYGLLFASPEPLSFTDILEQLSVSRGSVSQGLQALREFGAVRSAESCGGRRELFEPELQLRALLSGILREKVNPILHNGTTRLKRLREHATKAPSPSGKKFVLERLRKIESWRRRTGLLLPTLNLVLSSSKA
jgi:DNA-binding transcriptional regulator GbsR (MarR family)